MRRLIAFALALMLSGSAVQAGAWARPAGEVFLSFSTNREASVEALQSGMDAMARHDAAYLEVGLGHRLTFSAELGRGRYTSDAMAILRYTLTDPGARLQAAVDLGAGQRSVEGQEDSTLARLGLSLGYGYGITPPDWMPLNLQGGWIALDASAIRDTTTAENRWKVETTFGLSISDRSRAMLQIVAEEWPGRDAAFTLNPSFVFQIHEGSFVEVGLRAVRAEDVQFGFELGFWRQF
jgi:hypothetical protein